MQRVLICSKQDLRPALAATVVGRQGLEVYRVEKFADVRLVGASLGVQVILVDSEFPAAAAFIANLRQEPATRERSIAVLARGSMAGSGLELLAAGANAIFPLPPDAGWDERFSKLLTVPVRQQARVVAHIEVATAGEGPAAILNLSSGGMFLVTQRALRVGDEFKFRFNLPDKTTIAGRGRVARAVPGSGFGVQFIDLDAEAKVAVLAFLRSARLDA
jgi:CheY-like chemotaxis protein